MISSTYEYVNYSLPLPTFVQRSDNYSTEDEDKDDKGKDFEKFFFFCGWKNIIKIFLIEASQVR